MSWTDARAHAALNDVFAVAVASAQPAKVLAAHLPERPRGRCVVVGAGKAAAAMARAVEAAWPEVDLTGLVVTRHGQALPTQRTTILESAHPVPDSHGLVAATQILDAVRGLRPDDLVLALISGGGSALMPLPAPGLTLADKQAVNAALLACGATITEMNAVRKHLSAIKGGRLAAAAFPARVVTLAISDVPGDDPTVIASGPTVPDPSTCAEVAEIVTRYRLPLPWAVRDHLARGEETPKPGGTAPDYRLIATPMMALNAAAHAARRHGLAPLILGDALEGEARELGIAMAGIARSVASHGLPLPAPALILSGGETTVTIGGGPAGRGGRNMEFALSLALALDGTPGIWALAADTDGIDGTEDAAGAVIGPETLGVMRAAGHDPRAALRGHDSFTVLDAIGALLRPGPTQTNVNDFRAILVAG
jgi:hydroxypyruvate reductase